MIHDNPNIWYGTTILAVKKGDSVIIAGDGQVSIGHTVVKSSANKIRRLGKDQSIVSGFAGATADAFTLFERLEEKLKDYPNQLSRAAVELAKDWRSDKYLRKLEAMMIVANKKSMFILTGNGDVLEPEDNIAAIGSGGNYALSAAKALTQHSQLTAENIVKSAMKIAADICVYTNHNIVVEKI
mgnify:CR=1 FL=1